MDMKGSLVPFSRPVFCGARKKTGHEAGLTCRRPAGWGTDHVGIGSCKLHGGRTPTHGTYAATTVARRVAVLYGAPREDVDPISGLMEELQRSAGLIDSYEAMSMQLTPDEVVFGIVSQETTRVVDPTAEQGDGSGAGAD